MWTFEVEDQQNPKLPSLNWSSSLDRRREQLNQKHLQARSGSPVLRTGKSGAFQMQILHFPSEIPANPRLPQRCLCQMQGLGSGPYRAYRQWKTYAKEDGNERDVRKEQGPRDPRKKTS